jgi:peptidylprolyl isomerase
MRRSLLLAATTLFLVSSACGGGDGDASPSATASPSDVDDTSAPQSTTEVTLPDAGERCEDQPDPAEYAEAEIPLAIRPCAIPTELAVHTIRTGTGPQAEPGDRLIVQYTGIRAEDGAIFDTSYTRPIPFDFPLGRGGVIQGWDDGLVDAKAGALIKLDIPNELAYGDTPPTDVIKPGDALSFMIDVKAVIPAVSAEDAPLDLQLEPSVGATEVTSQDIVVGDGAPVEPGDTAVVHMLLARGDNQIVIFNSWDNNDPLQIVMEEGATLDGILEGLEGASVGTLRSITVPPDKAFGDTGEPSLGLPAGTDLLVILDVVGVY